MEAAVLGCLAAARVFGDLIYGVSSWWRFMGRAVGFVAIYGYVGLMFVEFFVGGLCRRGCKD